MCLLRILVDEVMCHWVILVIVSVSALAHVLLGIAKVWILQLKSRIKILFQLVVVTKKGCTGFLASEEERKQLTEDSEISSVGY